MHHSIPLCLLVPLCLSLSFIILASHFAYREEQHSLLCYLQQKQFLYHLENFHDLQLRFMWLYVVMFFLVLWEMFLVLEFQAKEFTL